MKTKPGAKEAGTAPASNAPGFVFIRQKLMRSPLFEWSPGGGHPGGHQTAVGGFKWASWCAAIPLGRSEECRGTGGSRVGVWGCSLVSMATIPIQTTEAGFGRPWRCTRVPKEKARPGRAGWACLQSSSSPWCALARDKGSVRPKGRNQKARPVPRPIPALSLPKVSLSRKGLPVLAYWSAYGTNM